MTRTILFFLAMSFSAPQCASASEGFAVAGPGGSTCGQYLESGEIQLLRQLHVSWIQGFISGMNMARAKQGQELVELPDAPSIEAYMDKFCRDHPLDPMYQGAFDLSLEIEARWNASRKVE
jgi:hypothetical protein